MSIDRVQKRRIYEAILQVMFSTGKKPLLSDVENIVSQHFSKYPIGTPITLSLQDIQSSVRSDVQSFNAVMSSVNENLDVLYQSSFEDADKLMSLITTLNAKTSYLRKKRRKVMSQIDDFLLSTSNTDGYFYSIGDAFADMSLVDVGMTTAFIDIANGSATLPPLSNLTRFMPPQRVTQARVEFSVEGDAQASLVERSSFANALDGLSNTTWAVEVVSTVPAAETNLTVSLSVAAGADDLKISRIEVDPYSIVPYQLWIETVTEGVEGRVNFGNKSITLENSGSFVSDEAVMPHTIILNLRKDREDATRINESGKIEYVYIFGAKDVLISEHVYEPNATLVSSTLTLPPELVSSGNSVDSVSITSNEETPAYSGLNYYVALDNGGSNIGDFEWKEIVPVGRIGGSSSNLLAKFDGAVSTIRNIVSDADDGSADLELIPLNSTDQDLALRNPSYSIIPDVPTYRIVSFPDENVVPLSIKLEEGIDTTRIYYVDRTPSALDSLGFWEEIIQETGYPSSTTFGETNTGNGFFSGADVGSGNVSVYVETFLEADKEYETVLRDFAKMDDNSLLWDCRVFLNGRQMGYLPAGVSKAKLPWRFKEGLNHICVLVNIPESTLANPNSYLGAIDIMQGDSLKAYGSVRLDEWKYVDMFHMMHNQEPFGSNQPSTFTIHNGEIVSSKRPVANLRIKYTSGLQKDQNAVRFRADFNREVNNPNTTPVLNSYRVRFSYEDPNNA